MQNLIIYQKVYDFALYLFPIIDRFPKFEKFVLCSHLKNCVLDRVIHHAICNIIEPLFEKKFISNSYACRIGKGTHAGSSRLVEFLRISQRKWGKVYCLKADISKYFPSIDHIKLKQIIRRTIRCRKTLQLIDEIIDSNGEEKGLPIGNLTSQLFQIYI